MTYYNISNTQDLDKIPYAKTSNRATSTKMHTNTRIFIVLRHCWEKNKERKNSPHSTKETAITAHQFHYISLKVANRRH